MTVKTLGANKTVVTFSNGDEIFFSYQTPVVLVSNHVAKITCTKWSPTTAKHINQYLSDAPHEATELVHQDYLDRIVASVGL